MGGASSSSSYFFSRFFFRVLVVVGFVCFMIFGNLVSGGRTGQTTTRQWSEERVLKHDDEHVVGKDKGVVVVNHDAQLDFNYMSKRRVPNGPDPIHNRRAGNSGRPPGQT
ncbi:subtilisin CLE36 protein precursor [Trifolium repens]|nr:subtilisin CLE36 protein precursor [Trifolium repens]